MSSPADIPGFMEAYPESFSTSVTPFDIIRWFLIFIVPFLIPYIYIRFFKARYPLFIRDKLTPFIKFKLHLEKPMAFTKKILEFQIFGSQKNDNHF